MFVSYSALRLVGVSCAVGVLAFGSAASAQETAPPAPPPVPSAAPSASEVAKVNAAYANAMKAFEKAAAQMNQDLPQAFSELQKGLDGSGAHIRSFTVGPGAYGTLFGPRLPAQTISLDLKNVPVRDALVKILKEAKIGYVLDDDVPSDKRVTVSVSGAQVSTVLDLVTQSASVSWTTETRDKKTMVRVGKTARGVTGNGVWNFSNTLNDLRGQVTPNSLYFVGPKKGQELLPNAKITLNLEAAPLREALVDLLEKQNLAYDIPNDFPSNRKITAAFQSLALPKVLDSLTRSGGFTWYADKQNDKITVHVQKAPASSIFYDFNGSASGPYHPLISEPVQPVKPSSGAGASSGAGSVPLLYRYRTSEQRSTFTCPNCGKKTTVIHSEAGKNDKDEHEAHDGWLYCPFCGKKVVMPQVPAPPAPPVVTKISVFGSAVP